MEKSLDVMLDQRIQDIFQNFAESFGVTILFCTPDGAIRSRGRKNSPFCNLIQEGVYSHADCVANDKLARERCRDCRRIFSYRCYAGIEEAIAPIRSGGEIVGYAMFGQFRTGEKVPEKVLAACPAARREELQAAYRALPFFEPDRLPSILGLFGMIVDYIVEREMVVRRDSATIRDLERWMREHCAEPLTVEDAARRMKCSRSTITHQLRKKLGVSFQELLIETRLQKAESLLRSGRCVSIKEAAEAAGYDDPGYFSRLYRRKRGVTPGEFRKAR